MKTRTLVSLLIVCILIGGIVEHAEGNVFKLYLQIFINNINTMAISFYCEHAFKFNHVRTVRENDIR